MRATAPGGCTVSDSDQNSPTKYKYLCRHIKLDAVLCRYIKRDAVLCSLRLCGGIGLGVGPNPTVLSAAGPIIESQSLPPFMSMKSLILPERQQSSADNLGMTDLSPPSSLCSPYEKNAYKPCW